MGLNFFSAFMIGMCGFIQSASAFVASDSQNYLSARDMRVVTKAIYAGLEFPLALAGIQMDEQKFDRKVGKILLSAEKYGVMPSAITIGYYDRAQFIVGKTFGVESNFYLSDGKLRVSTYDLKAVNAGATLMFKAGFYIALCFGSCTGGPIDGTFVGSDADLAGLGADLFIEVGTDTTELMEAVKNNRPYSFEELMAQKAFFIGTGFDMGLGEGISVYYQKYHLKSDIELADLYKMDQEPNFEQKMRILFEHADLFKMLPRQ